MRVIFIFVIFVIVMNNVLSVEGVIPGSYEADFEHGLEKEFVFDFVLNDDEPLNVEGDLAEFVELDRDAVADREKVVVRLRLPENLSRIGINNIWIVAGNVKGLIKVHFPYPDKFVGMRLNAPNVNQGENVNIGLNLFNLGNKNVFVNSSIEIYEWLGSRGELIETFNLEESMINVSGEKHFDLFLNSSNYSAGDYISVAKIDYGEGVVERENIFRLGEFRVRILNYTNKFYGDKINQFEIEVENLWNRKLHEVYAGVKIVDSKFGFDTGIVKLDRWEKKVLIGYFDAKGIENDVDAEINLYYSSNATMNISARSSGKEIVRLNFMEGFDWISLIEIFLLLFIFTFILWRVVVIFNK